MGGPLALMIPVFPVVVPDGGCDLSTLEQVVQTWGQQMQQQARAAAWAARVADLVPVCPMCSRTPASVPAVFPTSSWASVSTSIHRLPPRATSVLALTGRSLDRFALLRDLLTGPETMYAAFLSGDVSSEWRDASAHLAYQGEMVQVSEGDRQLAGTLAGLDPSGALRLRLSDGAEREIWSGDLVRGPRPTGD